MDKSNVNNPYLDENHKFKKGNPGGGRPEGSISVISRLKKEFRENPEKFEEFIERYLKNPSNEKHVAEMIDGKPKQNVELEANVGLSINFSNEFNADTPS